MIKVLTAGIFGAAFGLGLGFFISCLVYRRKDWWFYLIIIVFGIAGVIVEMSGANP